MVSEWDLWSARGPFTVKKRPLFDQKALIESSLTWLFAIFTRKRSFALFCALLRSFALFIIKTCGFAFALICALLRSFACFCERPRLERPRMGTAEGRPQRADNKFVRARGPQIWNPEVFDQTMCSRTLACTICPE